MTIGPDELLREVATLLADNNTASIATVSPDGQPHAANVWYAHDGAALDLYFISDPGTAHARHVQASGRAALAVYAPTQAYAEIRGLQIHADVAAMDAPDQRAHAHAVYAARFPFITAGPIAAAVAERTFYRARPTWLRWIDNRRGFGFKAEHRFA